MSKSKYAMNNETVRRAGALPLMICGVAGLLLSGCTTQKMPDMYQGKKAYNAKNYEEAVWHYQELAEFGMPRAKIELGKHYLYGRGVERNPEKALQLFQEAAAEGERARAESYIPRAKAKLAKNILRDNIHGYTDDQAITMLMEAAEADSRDGYFELGYAYEKGLGVRTDGEKASTYYGLSADKGYSRGTFYQGRLYMKGDLVRKDIPLALSLYEKAAKNGYPRAYTELGEIYEKGDGVRRDPQKAAQYYRLAQQNGENVSNHLARVSG